MEQIDQGSLQGGVLINLPSSASRADIEEQNPIAVSLSAL